jgi:hypothetical protein
MNVLLIVPALAVGGGVLACLWAAVRRAIDVGDFSPAEVLRSASAKPRRADAA